MREVASSWTRRSIYKHLVTPECELWQFRRSAAFMAIMVSMFAAGCAILGFLAVVSFVDFDAIDRWGGLCLLLPLFPEGLGVWYVSRHPTLLTVYRTGRVCFGKRQLCGPGTVRAVRIISRRHEPDEYDVYMELNTGKLVLLPPHYLGSFDIGPYGRTFAAEVAKALAVDVTESA